jgi:RNA polymerase sigma-70 factor (sigma-E family)
MHAVDVGEVVHEERGRFGELYSRHAPEAARLAYLLTGDGALAEDLVHDAFVRMIGRFRDLRNPDSFNWYLKRTVVNLANSHFRHARVERLHREREGRAPRPAAMTADVEGREDMWRSLQLLPQRQRAAIVLRFYEDLSEARVAELLSCPVGTVKSLVSRGLKRLRAELGSGE